MIKREFYPLYSPDEAGGGIQPNAEALNPMEVISDWEGYSTAVQNALRRVGMIGAESFTPSELEKFGTEIIRHLNPLTAECLFFDAYRASLKENTRGLVTPSLLIDHAKYHKSYGMDLVKLQLLQRSDNLGWLYKVHIDGNQVLKIASGSEEMRQNINRLTFFLFDTQELAQYARSLQYESSDEQPNSIEEVIIESQAILNKYIDELNKKKKTEHDEEPDPEERWTPFKMATFVRLMHRMRSRVNLGDLILEEIRSNPTTPDDWFGESEHFTT